MKHKISPQKNGTSQNSIWQTKTFNFFEHYSQNHQIYQISQFTHQHGLKLWSWIFFNFA